MPNRLLSLLLVFVLSWAGFPALAQSGTPALSTVTAALEGATGGDHALADIGRSDTGGFDTGPLPVEGSFPAQAEVVSDLPVVIHHGAEAPLPAATMAPPGAPTATDWRSACLDGLQRPPSTAFPAV